MTYLLKLLVYCSSLSILNVRSLKAEQSFEDAELVNEFITMSFSSSHPYDLRQTIPGEPEIDYPIYSTVPRTNFDCNGRHEGYYADIETRCQVFRICANTDLVGKGFAFLCPNGTLFSQKNFVCDWYRNVDCNNSERFYSKNDNNRIGTKTDMMKTVRQMMEHPMKTINVALNRGKSTTPQPTTYFNRGTSTTKAVRNFRPSSTPATRFTAQDTNPKRQPITLNQVETASRFASPLQQIYPTQQTELLVSSPSDEGFRPSNLSSLTITPPSPTFTPPFETPPSSAPYESPLSSDNNAPYETYPSSNINADGTPLLPTEDSTNEKDVYVSSLGELSTDPGANFNRQTSRIIADPPSNSLELVSKPSNASGMNFAEKVNAGLNGQQIVNRGEVIAPEYVKNIIQQNVPVPDNVIQPPSFDFASNINSLLDEINYEAELEGQNSLQFQQQTSAKEASATTKKPFRFLSRGFSHENPKTKEPYVYSPTTSAPRNSYRDRQQVSSSTQSYSNSFLTTSLTTTPAPITLLETTETLVLDTNSEDSKTESAATVNRKSEASLSHTNKSDIILNEENKSNLSETSKIDKTVELQSLNKSEFELEPKLDPKPVLKREQKELKQKESFSSINNQPQDLDNENKAHANKRAEDLLLAGVKQITVNDLDDKGKTTDAEETSPIVPIYNRVKSPETTTPHLTSFSTTSITSPPTTTPKTTSTPVSSSTTSVPTFSLTTTTLTSIASSTTSEPLTTPAVSIRRFTVGSGNRRQTSRPITYSRRNNLPRSGTRTTSTTKATITTSPTYRGRSRLRSTSTTSGPSSTKITTSPRKRLNINRYTYGSRRRTTESTISTSASSSSTTTTIAPQSKKISVRSSDSSLSDLTAVASTYNAAPNRAYNSIRQSSYKYTQTQRRHPSQKNNSSATITTKSPIKSTTTQQPRSSSSYPTPTLDPFSHNKALSPIPISSTTPQPLPATFLSFNDLTKSIIDDSILQTLRKNQDFSRQLIDSKAFRSQQQASSIQQIPFSTLPRVQQGFSTQRPPLPKATTLPFIPLKDFIASKFGSQYSPEPPKLSTARPALITSGVKNDFSLQAQKKQVLDQQYTKQQYGVRQEYLPHPQANQAINPLPPVQLTQGISAGNQNVFQQQVPLNVQQQQQFQQQQYQEQLRLQQQQQQQQQQKLQQLKQQQNQLAKQYQIQQQQKIQQQQQQIQQQQIQQQKLQQQQQLQQQKLLQQREQLQQQQQIQQQKQVSPQQYLSTNQLQIFPSQQYSQQQQTIPTIQQQQQQRIPVQQQVQRNSVQQVSTKIVPSVEQQFEIQRSQQIQQPKALPPPQQQFQQRQQQSQIQIIPSQMTVFQTIPPQPSNVKSEIGSINVRLPSNVAALIPNTNLYDSRTNSNSIESAQRRSDQSFEDAYGARERKSVYAGVSSYDVPLSSVGRLANDITNFLRHRRL